MPLFLQVFYLLCASCFIILEKGKYQHSSIIKIMSSTNDDSQVGE